MEEILKKIFLDEIKGHKRTVCIICGFKSNMNQPPFISRAVLSTFGTCVCSYCVNKTSGGLCSRMQVGVKRCYL